MTQLKKDRKQVMQEAVDIACESAGKLRAKEVWVDVETDLIFEVIKREFASEWNGIMSKCKEAKQMGGQMLEFVFEAECTVVGIEAMQKAKRISDEIEDRNL